MTLGLLLIVSAYAGFISWKYWKFYSSFTGEGCNWEYQTCRCGTKVKFPIYYRGPVVCEGCSDREVENFYARSRVAGFGTLCKMPEGTPIEYQTHQELVDACQPRIMKVRK